ncbi:cytochrome oxidase subunit 2 (mitochondrion) [Schizosaccharomyces pombe]|uniref:Cytochrome c oxidase subunit 2 n=2 Tax=Dikarya TaxID=451864 RepID=A0A516ILL7_SCHPM|nr:cytochrome oxidase subunit 2 [Schizosaccharomyces pombe]QDP17104.1 cytochrome oxidase subunit 2 [Schizosaccharomyces pombe]QDP17115.1 cytochrome oxidase subunit 2 [Schizosaccharomyces pombe]QDP17126.1 cytochrome oxidase subunit 2 [Schizosaccharomyces pombe]QDP17137.1 cytochrome oxidase subunit 2 [Schizosaccharomyces pombe]
MLFFNSILNDAPSSWALYFQDGASPSYLGITHLNDYLMFYLTFIFIGVIYAICKAVIEYNYNSHPIAAKYTTHGSIVEFIWTLIPALILILVALPSFKLLYLLDEVQKPSMTVKAIGRQWFWSYELNDFVTNENEPVSFDSYMVPEEDLEEGSLRQLEVDNRLVLPIDTRIRLILTSGDVIHSWAVPSLGIKCDCIPGRLNQVSLSIDREGLFYGQCSELCGVLHSSMPIVVQGVSLEDFLAWLEENS